MNFARTLLGAFSGLTALTFVACESPCEALSHARHNGTTACGDCVGRQCNSELAAALNTSECNDQLDCFNYCFDPVGGPADGGGLCACEATCLTTTTCRTIADNLFRCETDRCAAECL